MNIKGTVYSKDGQEKRVGIPVSDGRNVVYTDENGHFMLPGWERARLLFACVLTFGHDDWYLHIQNHQGDYDFYLDPLEGEDDFSFLQISDTEIENARCSFVSYLRKLTAAHNPAFFMHTGDLCRGNGVRRHYLAMNSETMDCPVRYAIGNHDFCGDSYGEQLYEQLYGPTWYSFDYGGVHFVVTSIGKGDQPSGYQPEDQWRWLENDLKQTRNKSLIVLNHTHCTDATGFRPSVNGKPFDFRERGLLAWCFGHYHIQMAHEYNGTLNICASRPDSGGIDSSPGGVRKIRVQGQKLTTEVLFHVKSYKADPAVWSRKLPGQVQFSAPLAVDGDVIVCTCDDGYPKQCGVFRLSGVDGRIQ